MMWTLPPLVTAIAGRSWVSRGTTLAADHVPVLFVT